MAPGQAVEGAFCCDIPLELILVISEHLHLKDRWVSPAQGPCSMGLVESVRPAVLGSYAILHSVR